MRSPPYWRMPFNKYFGNGILNNGERFLMRIPKSGTNNIENEEVINNFTEMLISLLMEVIVENDELHMIILEQYR